MDGLSKQVFPRAALPLDQYGDVGLRNLLDDCLDLTHLGAMGKNDPVNIVHGQWEKEQNMCQLKTLSHSRANFLKSNEFI
jgi:hypothetical protein